jgi:adenosylmethionine-8-amino-7-oxononanoate aminotransferase
MNLTEADRAHVWHPFTQHARWEQTPPLIVAAAEGNYLIDTDGRRYLDGVSSLWTNVHGHRCAAIDAALVAQLGRVAHSTLLGLANVPSIELAAELARVSPAGLARVFYSDSGSTAVEVALKIAFQYWQLSGRPQKQRFVALDHAYHGDTLGAVSVGGIDTFHKIFHSILFYVHRLPAPAAPYARADAATPPADADTSLAALRALLATRADELAALILEPRVQGAAGMLVHPPGYLAQVAALCRAHDVLLICDEVATGFGRTGPLFACQAEDVAPDLLCLAKGLTGGYLPLAATLATERVFRAFCGDASRTFFHGHTYTGNPLACAAALAALRLTADPAFLARVAQRAQTLGELLAQRVAPLPHVGEVRRCGMMVGVELVADRAARRAYAPAAAIGARVCQAVRRHGVILRPLGDVVVLMPPLAIADDELDLLTAATAAAITEITETDEARR